MIHGAQGELREQHAMLEIAHGGRIIHCLEDVWAMIRGVHDKPEKQHATSEIANGKFNKLYLTHLDDVLAMIHDAKRKGAPNQNAPQAARIANGFPNRPRSFLLHSVLVMTIVAEGVIVPCATIGKIDRLIVFGTQWTV